MKKIISLLLFLTLNSNAFELNEQSYETLRDTLFELTARGEVKSMVFKTWSYVSSFIKKEAKEITPRHFLIPYEDLHMELEINNFYSEVRRDLQQKQAMVSFKDIKTEINEKLEFLEKIMDDGKTFHVTSDSRNRQKAIDDIAATIFTIANIVHQPESDLQIVQALQEAMSGTL